MAFINKLFSNKRKNLATSTVQQNTSQFPFNKEQVRILLYRECDYRGRRLLFDSNAIQRVVITNNINNDCNNITNNINNISNNINCNNKIHNNSNSNNINTNNNNNNNININNSNNTSNNNHININLNNNKTSSGKQYNNNGTNSNFIDVSEGIGYKYGRSTPDGGSIGEMVFGSVAMSFRGTSLKVHWLHSPSRILCSQVFLSPLQTKMFTHNNNYNSIDTNYSDISSTETSSLSSFSLSVSVCVNDNLNGLGVDVPTPELIESRIFACSTEDSGYSGTGGTGSGTDPWNASSFCPQSSTRSSFGSVYSDQDSFRKMSIDSSATSELNPNISKTSDGNLQRRVLRNLSTSFENRTSMSDYIGYISDNNNYQNHQVCGGSDGCVAKIRRNSETIENRSNPEMIRKKTSGDFMYHTSHGPYPSRSNNRRAKLGLVIQITLSESRENEMQTFCSEHVALLESILCRLRTNAEKAYVNRQNFLPLMLRAWRSTSLWITDLFTAPRIANPIWITLSSGNTKNPAALANNFMNELCELLTYADTKDTRFFVSTLLTAILTHHLGWVGTVAPVSSQLNSSLSEIKKALKIKCFKMSEISKTHPYNALWAQMTDLYGAIGYPPKLSKTIVCGNDTNIIEKILNILTYFIRCGEIKRESNEKVIDKCTINNIMNNISTTSNENSKTILNNNNRNVIDNTKNVCYNKKQIGSCLTRSATCVKDLSEMPEISTNNNINDNNKSNNKLDIIVDTNDNTNLVNAFKKNIMNDIPNVLAYRDSRFVQQELRIGNHLMDTGIVMDVKQKQELKSYQIKSVNDNENNNIKNIYNNNDNKNLNNDIKVTITSPDNYEFHVTHSVNKVKLNTNVDHNNKIINNNNNNNYIKEIDKHSITTTNNNNKQLDTDLRRTKSLHNKKETVKLTRKISVPKLDNLNDFNNNNNNNNIVNNNNNDNNTTKFNHENNTNNNNKKTIKTCPSLGDLITANSVGQSERFLWGIERVKEGVSLEQKRHMELGEKIINRNDDVNNVVFVLGDNEELIGLKNTIKNNNDNENSNNNDFNKNNKINDKLNGGTCCLSPSSLLSNASIAAAAANTSSASTSSLCRQIKFMKKEPTDQLTIDTTLTPQILLHKKLCNRKYKKHSGVKFNFEQYPQIATNYMKNKNLDIANYNFLEKGLKMEREMKLNYGQCSNETIVTPDSIAEHDDDDNYECECCRGCEDSHILQTPSNASELEYSSDITTDEQSNFPAQSTSNTSFASPILSDKGVTEFSDDNSDDDTNMAVNINEKQREIKKCDKLNITNLQVIELPISRSRDKVIKKTDNNSDDSKISLSKEQSGFTPSLFTGITDHYIPDMVLQGTIASPSNFEAPLRHDLMIASHCAIFEQTATENIAIIANTDKWDVHVVSSQSFVLPHGYGTQGSVGMSQLVASMLETVLVMWGAGTPAFQCMSYLEDKLQEMYLQSETLAAFLLGTDFCTLSTLTKALNLSENDVPLLLSVASIHSPQVSKKYGISFR